MTIVAIIPARGGSKGIANKNLTVVGTKTLLHHAVLQAKAVSDISEVYVSSEHPRVLEMAEMYGAIGVERPVEMAGDYSPSEDALKHVLSKLILPPSIVVMLQCTSPIRRPRDIKRAIKMVRDEGYDSVLSVTEQHQFVWSDNGEGAYPINYSPHWRPMRQSIQHFIENGSLYVFRPWVLAQYNSRLGGKIGLLVMPTWSRFEIDTPDDLDIVEWVMSREDLY